MGREWATSERTADSGQERAKKVPVTSYMFSPIINIFVSTFNLHFPLSTAPVLCPLSAVSCQTSKLSVALSKSAAFKCFIF